MDSLDKKLFAQFFRRRSVPFGQYLGDTREHAADEDLVEEQLRKAIPLIGEVVFAFSTLERLLTVHLCEIINDRSDEPGMIVLQGMMYRQRVDLLERLSRSFLLAFGCKPTDRAHALLISLLEDLSAVGELRNRVVHADWGTIDESGFAFVRVSMSASTGLREEHMVLDEQSLKALIQQIVGVTVDFDAYCEAKEELVVAGRGSKADSGRPASA